MYTQSINVVDGTEVSQARVRVASSSLNSRVNGGYGSGVAVISVIASL